MNGATTGASDVAAVVQAPAETIAQPATTVVVADDAAASAAATGQVPAHQHVVVADAHWWLDDFDEHMKQLQLATRESVV